MKNRFFILFVLVLVLGSFTGCETDFDVNASYKDITIVYGILDPAQQYQYIRINKAYLGQGDALQYAQIADSITYDTALIFAKIDELKGDAVQQSIFLKPRLVHRSEDPNSPFYNPQFPYVLVYEGKFPVPAAISGNDTVWVNTDHRYRLEVHNKKTGKLVSSTTLMVKDFNISRPLFNPSKPFIKILNKDNQNTVKWRAAVNGRRFQAVYRFYYKEFTGANDTTYHSVDYQLGVLKSQRTDGTEDLEITFSGTAFYKYLGSAIPANPQLKRLPWKMDLIIAVIPDDFNIYLEVNEPSSSIVQERPEYTNIENGYGLFTSRFVKNRTFNIDTEMAADIRNYFQSIDGSFIVKQ
jgi:hypothetical protein